MTWSRMVWFATFLPVLMTTVAAQNNKKPQPIEPAELPADWQQRDLEGKWVAYREATGDMGSDSRVKEAWALALGAEREFDLLEWIAIYEGWQKAGPQLAKADAPQLMRAALWNLGALDSHDKDNAEQVMKQLGGVALGWFEAHPIAQRGKGAAIYAELLAVHDPKPAPHYLPPHDPLQVLVPWLDAPGTLKDFGGRTTAEPRVRYVHQALRALDGVVVFGRADALIARKVLALCKHRDARIRSAAFTTLSKLPAERIPYEGLAAIESDPALDAGQRQLATTALSYSSHPWAYFRVLDIARQAGHPGRLAAITRLGDIGDRTTAAALGNVGLAVDFQVDAAIATALRRIADKNREKTIVQPFRLITTLRRVGWLRALEDPRADEHAHAVATMLASFDQDGSLQAYVDAAFTAAVPHPFRPEQAEQVEAELQQFLEELLGK